MPGESGGVFVQWDEQGEASGAAALMAARGNCAVQDVDYAALRSRLDLGENGK